ncbi:hypothetical protein [Wolbachia endosymbiont of Encarsia formosa]|uniref:hypothetical protein n=1 Tax=Wolbachia endosymbiont of Encarsia formosa TaxID=77125 RepID=UPI0031BB56B6
MENKVNLPSPSSSAFIEQLFLFNKSASSLNNFLGACRSESALSLFIEELMKYCSLDKRRARSSLLELEPISQALFISSLDLYKLFVPDASGLTFLRGVGELKGENFVSFVRNFSSLIISLRRNIVHHKLQEASLKSFLGSMTRLCLQLEKAEKAVKSFLEIVGSDVPPREDRESLRSSERSRSGGETLLPHFSSLVKASSSPLPSQASVSSEIMVNFSTSSESPAKKVIDLSRVVESALCSSYLASPKVLLSSRSEFTGSVPQSGDKGLKSQETSFMESGSRSRTSRESLRSSEYSRGESGSRSRTSRESLRSSEYSRGESGSRSRTSRESLRSSEYSRGESGSRSRTSRESLRSSVSCQDYGQASYLSYYTSNNSPFPPQRFAYAPPFPLQHFAYAPPFPLQHLAYAPPFPPQRFAYAPPFPPQRFAYASLPRSRSLPDIGRFPSHVRSSLPSQHVSGAASSASSVSSLRSTDNPVSLPSDVPSGSLECVQSSQEAKDITR